MAAFDADVFMMTMTLDQTHVIVTEQKARQNVPHMRARTVFGKSRFQTPTAIRVRCAMTEQSANEAYMLWLVSRRYDDVTASHSHPPNY